METKASYVLIGAFVLILIVGIFGFIIWLSHGAVTQPFAYYRIFFTESVAGLGVGGDVRFDGVRVGSVKQISIDRENPNRVKVLIEVDRDTPIRTGTYAKLQLQGITGVSYVALVSGDPKAPLLEPGQRNEPPKIPARPSEIAQLVANAPALVSRATEVLERMNQVFDEQNRSNLSQILADTASLTASLKAKEPEIDGAIDHVSASAADLAATAHNLRRMSGKLDRLTNEAERTLRTAQGTFRSGQDLISDSRKAAAALAQAAAQIDAMVAENRPAVRRFTAGGLGQLTDLLAQSRQLVQALTELTRHLEENPSRLLYGNQMPERTVPP